MKGKNLDSWDIRFGNVLKVMQVPKLAKENIYIGESLT
jgi:hypothetical protein